MEYDGSKYTRTGTTEIHANFKFRSIGIDVRDHIGYALSPLQWAKMRWSVPPPSSKKWELTQDYRKRGDTSIKAWKIQIIENSKKTIKIRDFWPTNHARCRDVWREPEILYTPNNSLINFPNKAIKFHRRFMSLCQNTKWRLVFDLSFFA